MHVDGAMTSLIPKKAQKFCDSQCTNGYAICEGMFFTWAVVINTVHYIWKQSIVSGLNGRFSLAYADMEETLFYLSSQYFLPSPSYIGSTQCEVWIQQPGSASKIDP